MNNTEDKITLRKISVNDADIFYEMATSSTDIKKYIPGIVASNKAKNYNNVKRWAEFDHETKYAFIICYRKNPAGFILATQDSSFPKSLNVDCFCSFEYRHKKIASIGMYKFIEICRQDNFYNDLILDIKTSNTAAINHAEKKLGAVYTETLNYGIASFKRFKINLR